MNYRQELIENLLPFWLEHGMDWENGGIYTCLDREGCLYGTEKSVWFQGRALWVFSKAYTVIDRNPQYLKAAKCLYDFLTKCVDTDGRMYFTVTADGRGIQKRRYFFSETFAAIGSAEYYRASRDEDALIQARTYFDTAYACFTGERYTEPKFNPETRSMKSLSPVMIMLSTAQTMRAVDSEQKSRYSRIAEDCLNEILNGGFLTDRALFEHVAIDGTTLDTPTGRIVNPGHSMETAWFLILEGLLTNQSAAVEAGKKIIDITLPLGWDETYGGIKAFVDVSGQPPVQLEWDMKLWWPQCETILAARFAYELFRDESYKALCEKLENYCERYFVDAQKGEWYGYLHYDNTVSTTLKGNIFKGPFHIPRLYIIMALLNEGHPIEAYINGIDH